MTHPYVDEKEIIITVELVTKHPHLFKDDLVTAVRDYNRTAVLNEKYLKEALGDQFDYDYFKDAVIDVCMDRIFGLGVRGEGYEDDCPSYVTLAHINNNPSCFKTAIVIGAVEVRQGSSLAKTRLESKGIIVS